MEPLTTITGRAVPLRAENVDTDQIIPARFLTTTSRQGLGAGLFADGRRGPDGAPRADFPLNRPEYGGATILLAGRNFGCGSSREHAAWAIADAGFRAVVAPRFADIFYENALKNGVLPVPLEEDEVVRLFERVEARPETPLTIDLAAQTLRVGGQGGESFSFAIDGFRKTCLLRGVDELGYLLALEPSIAAFERARGEFT